MAQLIISISSAFLIARATEGAFEENMTVCVESLIGEEGGRECVKLETQVLITARGAERLDAFPWEDV